MDDKDRRHWTRVGDILGLPDREITPEDLGPVICSECFTELTPWGICPNAANHKPKARKPCSVSSSRTGRMK